MKKEKENQIELQKHIAYLQSDKFREEIADKWNKSQDSENKNYKQRPLNGSTQ